MVEKIKKKDRGQLKLSVEVKKMSLWLQMLHQRVLTLMKYSMLSIMICLMMLKITCIVLVELVDQGKLE